MSAHFLLSKGFCTLQRTAKNLRSFNTSATQCFVMEKTERKKEKLEEGN